MVKRNGMLTTLSVIAMTFAALGIASILFGVGVIVFKDKIESRLASDESKVAQIQKEMQAELTEKIEPWKPFTYGSLFLKAGVVVLLMLGGIKAYKMDENGRSLLVTAFIAGIIFEALSFYPILQIQQSTMEVTTKYQKRIMEAQQPPGTHLSPEAEAIFEGTMKAGLMLGLLVAFGWIALKVAFYTYGFYYMRKPQVVALYEGGSSPENFLDEVEE